MQTEKKPMQLTTTDTPPHHKDKARHITLQDETIIAGFIRPCQTVNAPISLATPPDASLGPDTIMQAIDEWFADCDQQLLAMSQPASYHYPLQQNYQLW